MGLPATGKVTLASAVVMVMVWALEPGPRQSSGARPSRSGTVNSGATSPTEEGNPFSCLEADGQSTFQCPVFLLSGQGPGGGRGFGQSLTQCPFFPHLKQGPRGVPAFVGLFPFPQSLGVCPWRAVASIRYFSFSLSCLCSLFLLSVAEYPESHRWLMKAAEFSSGPWVIYSLTVCGVPRKRVELEFYLC